MTARLLKRHYLYLLLAPVILGLSAIITGCGGEEEEPPVEEPSAVPASESSAEVVAPKPAGPAMAETVPSTLPALAFMPAEAQIAVALPALPGLRDQILPLVKALSEPERDIDAEMKQWISDAAMGIGVQADSLESLAESLGVDSAAPIAAFVDVTRMVDSAVEAKAKYDAVLAEQAAKEAGAAAAETAAPGAEPEGSEPAPDEFADEPEFTPDYFADADKPDVVFVLGVTDPAKVRAELERIAAGESGQGETGSEEVDGITITTRDDLGFFTTDKHIAIGSLDLLRGAAKRVKDPASFRYGTVECPPKVADEAAALVFGSRLLPLYEKGLPLFGMDSGAEPLVKAQMIKYKDMFSVADDDPMVLTASIANGEIELLSRMDTKSHAGIMEKTGQPAPLRLARYLPDSTLAMISLRFTEEYKKQLLEEVVPVVSASDDPNAAAGAGMAVQVINQIGDELSIGIAGAEGGLPNINVLLGLSQPESTKGLLQMLAPPQGGVDYEGFSIGKIPTPIGLDVNLSFVDNFLLATTSEEGAKAIIDLHKAQKASALFSSLEPPLEIEAPVYNTVVLNSGIIDQLLAIAPMIPGAPPTTDPGLVRFNNAVREIRAIGAVEDGWLTGRWTVYLKDLEAAIAASKAAAATSDAAASEVPAPEESATTEAQ